MQCEERLLKGCQFSAWRVQSNTIRDKLGLASAAAPWTRMNGVHLRGVPRSERVTDLIDIAFALWRAENPSTPIPEIIKNRFLSVCQRVESLPRRNRASGVAFPSLPSNTCPIYSYERDTVLSGKAHMALSGWHADSAPAEHFSDGDLRNLAGECFSVQAWAQVFYVFYLLPKAPWWK